VWSRRWIDERALTGRAAVVTGAARGIGLGVAQSLADAGAEVLLADLDEKAVSTAADNLGGRAAAASVDVADPASVAALRDGALERYGRVDVLVNNAGVISVAPVLELEWEEWTRVMTVNAGGTFLCSRAFARPMVDAGSGAIVNMASVAGKRGDPTLAHYSASKFAVIGFTQALAQELAPAGVTVNAVCPGTVDTPMMRDLADRWGDSVHAVAARFQAQARPQSVTEIGQAVIYLACSPAVTGQALNVDGGAVFH
jgi:meso-butanediol dehydrogenase / (S,S)-butanediol dehydrogenase / diacetyl reductase